MPCAQAPWFWPLLGGERHEGEAFACGGQAFRVVGGIPRALALHSEDQQQTGRAFGYKWAQRDTFESAAVRAHTRAWLEERYGGIEAHGWLDGLEAPLVLDAGCGAGHSALEYFRPVLGRIRYLGVDISEAVEVACARCAEAGLQAGFLQADLARLPLPEGIADLIFSEGVLHHTDDTRAAFHALVPFLKPGGRFLFYVYRRKGPVREFTDDHIRAALARLSPEEAWRAMEPLTRLGIALGELGATIEIPEPVDLLGIPAGRIDVQRLFYQHVAKAFWRPDMSFDEMNHINFDWYAPRNAHRHTEEEARSWCAEAGLAIEREVVQPSGITVVARRLPGRC